MADQVTNKLSDLNKGEIYYARSRTTGKGYVGQAQKYISFNNNKWGTFGRWNSHIKNAIACKNKCNLLETAIRELGPSDFVVKMICECDVSEMDDLEKKYIEEYNTLHPNGYNMINGRNITALITEAKGNELAPRQRQLNVDALPKHEFIQPIILNDKLLGYQVIGMIDNDGVDIPPKQFIEKETNRWNWDNAIKYFDAVKEALEERRVVKDWGSLSVPDRRPNQNDEYLPPYMRAIFYGGIKEGYKIDSYPLVHVDGTVQKITKQFTHSDYTLEERKQMALDYMNDLRKQSQAAKVQLAANTPIDDDDKKEMTYIYIIKNKTDGKCFIGRAKEFLYCNKKPFGMNGCWQQHVREADKGELGMIPALHKAMKLEGVRNFEMTQLDYCEDSISNDKLKEFIQQYNCLAPNGYNLTEGKGGKKSEESSAKIKAIKNNMSQDAKEAFSAKMREINLGRIMDKGIRKHSGDEELPKYISAIREQGVVIGYKIDKFPIGNGEKLRKQFKSKSDPKEALSRAVKALDELYVQYPNVRPQQQSSTSEELSEPETQVPNPKLPENVSAIITSDGKIKGYKAEGEGIPMREFTSSYNNTINLDQAVRYIEQIKQGIINQDDPIKRRPKTTLSLLPKYINKVHYSGEHKGYCIKGLTYTNEHGETVNYSKQFTNQQHSLEENLRMAKEHLAEKLKEIENVAHKS